MPDAEPHASAHSYEVLGKLAEGGMTEIFLARAKGAGAVERFAVLKRLKRAVASHTELVKLFLDEARLASQLQHPNVAQVFEVGKLGGSYFFAMEFVNGETLQSLMLHARTRKIQVPVRAVLTIAAAAASGLHHAHDRRGTDGDPLHIVHGDLSPTNVLVSQEGIVKLVDFGAAKAGEHASGPRVSPYASPEQCSGAALDRRSDLFSLGVVLWELLTLEGLYHRATDHDIAHAILTEPPTAPSTKRYDVPPELDAMVLRLLAKHPSDRYQDADELLASIEALAQKLSILLSTADLSRMMRLWFGTKSDPAVDPADVEAPPPLLVSSEAIPDDLAIPVESPIDLQLESIRSAAALITARATERSRNTTGRPDKPPTVPPELMDNTNENFEQIRDRILARARQKKETQRNAIGAIPLAQVPATEARRGNSSSPPTTTTGGAGASGGEHSNAAAELAALVTKHQVPGGHGHAEHSPRADASTAASDKATSAAKAYALSAAARIDALMAATDEDDDDDGGDNGGDGDDASARERARSPAHEATREAPPAIANVAMPSATEAAPTADAAAPSGSMAQVTEVAGWVARDDARHRAITVSGDTLTPDPDQAAEAREAEELAAARAVEARVRLAAARAASVARPMSAAPAVTVDPAPAAPAASGAEAHGAPHSLTTAAADQAPNAASAATGSAAEASAAASAVTASRTERPAAASAGTPVAASAGTPAAASAGTPVAVSATATKPATDMRATPAAASTSASTRGGDGGPARGRDVGAPTQRTARSTVDIDEPRRARDPHVRDVDDERERADAIATARASTAEILRRPPRRPAWVLPTIAAGVLLVAVLAVAKLRGGDDKREPVPSNRVASAARTGAGAGSTPAEPSATSSATNPAANPTNPPADPATSPATNAAATGPGTNAATSAATNAATSAATNAATSPSTNAVANAATNTATNPTNTAANPTNTATNPAKTAANPTNTATNPANTAANPTNTATNPTSTATNPTNTATNPTSAPAHAATTDKPPLSSNVPAPTATTTNASPPSAVVAGDPARAGTKSAGATNARTTNAGSTNEKPDRTNAKKGSDRDAKKPDGKGIEVHFAAGDFASTNTACTNEIVFTAKKLEMCAQAACQTRNMQLAKRWISAIAKASRPPLVEKCKSMGVEVEAPSPPPGPPAPTGPDAAGSSSRQ